MTCVGGEDVIKVTQPEQRERTMGIKAKSLSEWQIYPQTHLKGTLWLFRISTPFQLIVSSHLQKVSYGIQFI